MRRQLTQNQVNKITIDGDKHSEGDKQNDEIETNLEDVIFI